MTQKLAFNTSRLSGHVDHQHFTLPIHPMAEAQPNLQLQLACSHAEAHQLLDSTTVKQTGQYWLSCK